MESPQEPRYKWLAVPPEMHKEIVEIRESRSFRANHQVVAMLLKFYKSDWKDESLLNEVIARVRGDAENLIDEAIAKIRGDANDGDTDHK